VIFMTAYGTPEVTKGALELGVCRVMSKPFEMSDLEELLLQACPASVPRRNVGRNSDPVTAVHEAAAL
jgi:DNA-binding NtrC family response regulator